MSGGSLNYLASNMSDALFRSRVEGLYKKTCDEGNARIARILNPMHDRELSELMADVMCLLHALEWYESCDIGEESYKKYVNKFKAKWFMRTGKDRLNSYAEDLKALYKELDAELRRE